MTTLPASATDKQITMSHKAICYTQCTFSGRRYISVLLNKESEARLNAYHKVVEKLMAAQEGWMISNGSNPDADDAFLNATDGYYNLVPMRHFAHKGVLCEFRLQCEFSLEDNQLENMTISLQDGDVEGWQDVDLHLDDAVKDINAFIAKINKVYDDFVSKNDSSTYPVSLSDMRIDDDVLKSMIPNRAIDTIEIRGFSKNLKMNVLLTIIGSKPNCSANQYLDIREYLKLSGQ